MVEPFTMDTDAGYVFAPSPEPIEGTLRRICIVYPAADGRIRSAGTDMILLIAQSTMRAN